MRDYIASERWQTVLTLNGLHDFDAIWKLEAPWLEPPSRRRGGWSGVSRCELSLPDGGVCTVFLKRQENYTAWMWAHPWRGAPTFLREFKGIMHYRACGIPTLEPVYFAVRAAGKDRRAILITEEMTGFVSGQHVVERWLQAGAPARVERRRTLCAVAALLRRMHAHGIQHRCFFPKHVFIGADSDGAAAVRVIDLEKSRWRPFKCLCALRDLYTLNYRSLCWSRSDRLWFLLSYLQIARPNGYARWLWRRIAASSSRRSRLGAPARVLATGPASGTDARAPNCIQSARTRATRALRRRAASGRR